MVMEYENLLKKAAEVLLTVEKINNPLIAKARAKTCENCPKFDVPSKRCTVCGCFLESKIVLMTTKNVKKMGRIEITHCPLGLWGDKPIANLYRQLDGEKPL